MLAHKGTHDFERVGDDSNGHELFAVVSAVHHQGVCEALDNGALCFSEALHSISAGGVGDVDGGADLDIVTVSRCLVLARVFCGPGLQ